MIAIISAVLAAPPPAPPPALPAVPKPVRGLKSAAPAVGAKSCPAVRVLVCAQSNAAVDELVMRLSEPGIFDPDGSRRYAGATDG